MDVKLNSTFFGPDNILRKPGVYNLPEDWTFPKGTEVLEEEDKPAAPAKKPAAK